MIRVAVDAMGGDTAPQAEIADAAYVARSTLHRYFPDRASLLEAVRQFADEEIAAASDEAAIEAVRVNALGKKGSISELLKTLGGMSPEERQTRGAAINQLKSGITEAIATRKAALNGDIADLAPSEKFGALGLQRFLKPADLKGKPTIISVVPSLDTPVCQTQTKRFSDELAGLGDKINARNLVAAAGVPVSPGTDAPVRDSAAALAAINVMTSPYPTPTSAETLDQHAARSGRRRWGGT